MEVDKRKIDVFQVFHHFHILFERSFNVTFVALIPKKSRALEVKDFCPIRALLHKLIAIVLSSRLKMVLEKVASTSQSASVVFVYGRQILDCVLIANECLVAK